MAENNNNAEEQSNGLEFQDLLFLSLSKWYWFVLSVLACVALGVLVILRSTPVYTRSATLLIKHNDSKAGASVEQQISELGGFNMSQVQDEIIALKSPAITSEVVKRLHLDVNYSVAGTFHDYTLYGDRQPIEVKFLSLTDTESASFTVDINNDGSFVVSNFVGPNTTDEDERKALKGKMHTVINTPVGRVLIDAKNNYYDVGRPIKVYRSTLKKAIDRYNTVDVSLMDKQSNMLSLTFRDVDIQRAVDVINTTIDVYNESWLDDRNKVAVSTSKFINERLRVIEEELGHVDKDISSFKSENMIPDPEEAGSAFFNKAEETGDRILELSNQLYMAKYVRSMVGNNKHELLPTNSGINNAAIERLIGEYNENVLNYNRLVSNSSTSNPLLEPLEERIKNQRVVIMQSIDNLVLTLETQKKNLERQEGVLNSKIASNPDQATYFTSIGREQKVKESLYIFLLQKREENELTMAYTAYNTRLITPPTGSNEPTSPVRRNILLIAFVLGLAIPFGLIYIREMLNTRVRGRKDIENSAIPYIGEIPLGYKRKGILKRIFTGKDKEKREIVVKPQNSNVINEAFRVLRSNFEFVAKPQGNGGVVTMVTSANVNSGKTFISANLAESLAIKNKKVCVVDLDLRKATSSAFVGKPKVGITNYIIGQCSLDEIKCKVNGQDNFVIVPVGTMPPNPSELLYEDRLAQAINELRQEYDYIFLDCPPVEIVADASIIRNYADLTVFVIRAHVFERSMLPEIDDFYNTKRYPNMVMVLNGTEDAFKSYGYHRYGYSYGYRYGYRYGYGTSRGYGNTSED
ncbi:MAG: polysaccharide biosynthesis tyrosine autokinase [Bacteroidales bacterium]|nr:polysaccharide biosynthesis tyrosine autokinase [Bacteroidales bacterium]